MKLKKIDNIVKSVIKDVVERTVVSDSKKTSCGLIYQPKVPAKLDNYKKDK